MTKLSFYEKGKGKSILLVHGFPMNAGIWEKFSAKLSSSFHVLTVDLPGFGSSPLPPGPLSIEEVGEIVLGNLLDRGIDEIVPIGHSLGGYVVLSMVKKKRELFPGFGLLHSTALADSDEKKESRNKVIEFIKKNGARAFTSNFIAPLFADPNHPDVPFVREMNMKTSEETLIAYTTAMRDRPDQTELLEQYNGNILFLAGDKDPGIPTESVRQQAAKARHSLLKIIPGQAHMSLIEDVQTSSSVVYDFALKCFHEA